MLRYEVDDGVAKDYPNVITGKWWPQKDLLVHPKLLAFITHGECFNKLKLNLKCLRRR